MKLTVQKQFSRNANSHRCEWSGRMLMSVRKAATDLYLCFFIMEIFCTNHQYIIYSLKKKAYEHLVHHLSVSKNVGWSCMRMEISSW